MKKEEIEQLKLRLLQYNYSCGIALTQKQARYLYKLLSQPTQGECKYSESCGHNYCNLDDCPEFEPNLQIANREPQFPLELRDGFEM